MTVSHNMSTVRKPLLTGATLKVAAHILPDRNCFESALFAPMRSPLIAFSETERFEGACHLSYPLLHALSQPVVTATTCEAICPVP
uniref:Uncharacterized protein n=1 Tax=Tetraselmis sp. GSL018 TaxID=582737 RepID=A0A061R2Y3_9CHLO